MHKKFACYAGIMLMLLATYYAPNYASIIGAGLEGDMTNMIDRHKYSKGHSRLSIINWCLLDPKGMWSIPSCSIIPAQCLLVVIP